MIKVILEIIFILPKSKSRTFDQIEQTTVLIKSKLLEKGALTSLSNSKWIT